MKTYQSDIHAFVGGCIRCMVGSVSERSCKCGGRGGLGFGLFCTEYLYTSVIMHQSG